MRNIQHRKLLKRAVEYLPDKEIDNAQIRDRMSRMNKRDLAHLSHRIADNVGIAKHNVIAYLSNIPVSLYEGEILIMWKDMPRKLDEFSPIRIDKSTIHKFYIFGPADETAQQNIKEYAERHFCPTRHST